MANLRGLVYGLAGSRASWLWLQAVTILLSLLVLIWIWVRGRGQWQGGAALVLAVTASVVVSYYLFIHDLSILLIPIVLTLDRFIGREKVGEPGLATAVMSVLLFVAPMCVFVIPGQFYLVAILIYLFLYVLTMVQGELGKPSKAVVSDSGV